MGATCRGRVAEEPAPRRRGAERALAEVRARGARVRVRRELQPVPVRRGRQDQPHLQEAVSGAFTIVCNTSDVHEKSTAITQWWQSLFDFMR